MCNLIIAHHLPCLHQRCTSVEICERAKATPGLSPFECPESGPVFLEEAAGEACPVCEARLREERREQDGCDGEGDGDGKVCGDGEQADRVDEGRA